MKRLWNPMEALSVGRGKVTHVSAAPRTWRHRIHRRRETPSAPNTTIRVPT